MLGDLHAHVVNVMFVLFLVGLLYAWMRSVRMREAVIMKPGRKPVSYTHLDVYKRQDQCHSVLYQTVEDHRGKCNQ